MVLRRAKTCDLLFAGCKAFPKCGGGIPKPKVKKLRPKPKPKRAKRQLSWDMRNLESHMAALARAVARGEIDPQAN